MLFLLQPTTGPAPSPEEMQQIMQHFMVWMQELRAKDLVVDTNGLDMAGKIVRGPRSASRVVDGPYVEAKEVVGGYILIRAESLDAAVEIARGCPGLDYRLSVEVREVRRPPA